MKNSLTGKHSDPKKIARIGIFTGLSLVIFVIEMQIPMPVQMPGVKLGLANIITMVMFSRYGAKEAFSVLILRIILASIFTGGNAMTFIYSFIGGLMSLSAMLIMDKILKHENIWFTSIIGGVFHNLGQMLAASIILKSIYAAWYFPVLILSGILTGIFNGILCGLLLKKIPIDK